MRLWRMILAVLALVALILGVPLHGAAAHGGMMSAGPSMHSLHHVHGDGKPCQHCPKSDDALCAMACAGAVAILDLASPTSHTTVAYAVRFPGAPGLAFAGVVLPPDPFPPRPNSLL